MQDTAKESRIKGTMYGLGVSVLKGVTHIPQKLLSTLEAPVVALVNVVGCAFFENCTLRDAAMSLFVDLPFRAVELVVSPVTTLVKGAVDGVGFVASPEGYSRVRAASAVAGMGDSGAKATFIFGLIGVAFSG